VECYRKGENRVIKEAFIWTVGCAAILVYSVAILIFGNGSDGLGGIKLVGEDTYTDRGDLMC